MLGQFLLKDILFFGAATYTAGKAAPANLMSKTYGRSTHAYHNENFIKNHLFSSIEKLHQ